MSAQEFDLVVIGGGNAIALARRAAGAGKRVALVERDLLGGTCPNRGCIPSKLLLGYADVARTIRDAHRFHIDAELHHIDTGTILVETQAATIGSTDRYFADHVPDGMTLFRGTGSFVGERLVEVTAEDGTTTRLTAPQVLIGTGSRPRRPTGLDDVPYWTSDEVFSLARLPQSVAVVGGGFIACELAYFLHAMGVPTEVLVRGDGLLLQADGDVRRKFEAGFTARVPTHLNTEVVSAESVEVDGYRQIRVTTNGPDGERTFDVEALLYAIGRVPNTDSLNCAAAGIELDDRGYVKVDDRLRTSAEGVYALGDVTGGYQFTHSASFEANYLGDVLLDGHDAPLSYGPMPAAVFSHPELASVGATEEELRATGADYGSVSVPYTSAAKGRALKERHGLAKLLFAPSGEILGFHVVGEHASILLHEVIPVMKWRNHVTSLTEIIHVHPSLPEVVRNVARKARAELQD